MPRSLTSVLTPHGALRLEPRESEPPIEEAVAERLVVSCGGRDTAFCNWGSARPALAFWRSFTMRFIAALCSRTEAISPVAARNFVAIAHEMRRLQTGLTD